MTSSQFSKTQWALILGASSGFGGACAVELARRGMNIFGVHFDRAATLPNVEKIVNEIQSVGPKALFFNINASDPSRRNEALDTMHRELSSTPDGTVRTLIHSLAFGTLKPYISKKPEELMTQAQVEMTLDVMAHSLIYWAQELVGRGLFREDLFYRINVIPVRVPSLRQRLEDIPLLAESFFRRIRIKSGKPIDHECVE